MASWALCMKADYRSKNIQVKTGGKAACYWHAIWQRGYIKQGWKALHSSLSPVLIIEESYLQTFFHSLLNTFLFPDSFFNFFVRSTGQSLSFCWRVSPFEHIEINLDCFCKNTFLNAFFTALIQDRFRFILFADLSCFTQKIQLSADRCVDIFRLFQSALVFSLPQNAIHM